jgi:hypothetical protein
MVLRIDGDSRKLLATIATEAVVTTATWSWAVASPG